MKKIIYVFAFGFLGLLVSTLIHGVVELVALDLIFSDPTNADSWWWREWVMIHRVFAFGLWIVGLFAGLYAGFKWWDQYGSKPGAFGLGKK